MTGFYMEGNTRLKWIKTTTSYIRYMLKVVKSLYQKYLKFVEINNNDTTATSMKPFLYLYC